MYRALAAILAFLTLGCGAQRDGAGSPSDRLPVSKAAEPADQSSLNPPVAGEDEPHFDGVPLSSLLAMLDDANPAAAAHAASALIAIGSPAVPPLEKRFCDGSPLQASQAIAALVTMAKGFEGRVWGTYMTIAPNPEAVRVLARCANAPNPLVRAMALRSIAKLGPKGKDALAAVKEATRDPIPAVRKAAEEALAAINSSGR
jgi:HEAT repeat protein